VCVRERPPFECAWDAGDGVAAHHVRAVAVLRDGGRLVANVRTKGAGFAPAVEVDLVPVAATVTDRGGRFVRGLSRESFRVFEDGVPQPVTHFIGEGTARELVVAVDMSGSMDEAMPVCRRSVKTFLSALRPDDQVTLLAFNDSLFTLARREQGAAARQRAVDRLAPWGGTALYDAVLRGLDLLERQRGRRALVLFSDGEDLSSHATVADVERRVEVSAAPIYVIAQGRGTQESELKRVLNGLSDVSGGRAFFTDSIEELEGVFAEITEDLANQYLLAYEPAKAERDGSWRTIKVEVVGQAHRVRARQGYRAVAKRR
jgi:Ca-activated chloride channel family protein